MDRLILKEKQADFIKNRSMVLEPLQPLFKKRDSFVQKFTIDYIKDMPIEDYVIGLQRTDTFCYMLEMGLSELGRIGGAPADKKFGLYYGKTKSDSTTKYRTIPKWGASPTEALFALKKEIVQLLEDGKRRNIAGIVSNKLSTMFKGKILATYFPDEYLAVFSEEHLDIFLTLFNIVCTGKADPVEKREKLLILKQNDSIMKNWTTFEFSKFLYLYFPPRQDDLGPGDEKDLLSKEERDLLNNYSLIEFPEFKDVKIEFVKFNIDLEENIFNGKRSVELKKIDYMKRERRNLQKGEKGEFYVMMTEKESLINCGRRDLSTRVRQVSLEDDSLGYDILSFDSNGNEKYIEVKSTERLPGQTSFFITANELEVAKKHPNYYIFIVYEVTSVNPKIAQIGKPFERDIFNLEPVVYRVSIKKSIKPN